MRRRASGVVRGAWCDELVVSLADATENARVGGKAANLARLIAMGVDVPAGDVLTAGAFAQWLTGDDLGDRIERETDSGRIASLVLASSLPGPVAAAIEQLGDRWLMDAPLVVRSSAIGEDGATASCAGQFESILHVSTYQQLTDAIRRCWASYWSPRAVFYRRARGIVPAGMAVIVQRQVPAVQAGVLFTQAPDGADGEMLIEGCAGLADGLVAGRVEPWSARVDVRSGRVLDDRRPKTPSVETRPDPICALTRVASSIAAGFGAPQDIEWAIDADDRVWIVQTRPITTLGTGPAIFWSNANVAENFPTPISPLLYSIAATGYSHYFRNLGLAFGVSRPRLRAMDRAFAGIIGVHGARMYYNLTNIHAILWMAPFGEALARSFNEFVGAEDIAAPPEAAARPRDQRGRVTQVLELARIAVATAGQYLFLRRRIATFERDADAYAARTRPADLDARSLSALNGDLLDFLDIRQHRWKNASLADAAAMVCYSLLQRVIAWCGAPASLHNRLLRALPGVPSSQPPLRLWALSRQIRADHALSTVFQQRDAGHILDAIRTDPRCETFRLDFDRYLTEWGFRSSAELMLTSPTLEEAPLPAIELLKQYVTSESEAPVVIMARQAADRRADTRALWRSLRFRAPHKAVTAMVVLRATQRAIAYRERARLKQALLYTRCRHVTRAIGRRLAERGALRQPDEVFMLRWQEIDEFASGRAMFASQLADLATTRTADHARLSTWTPPDRFVLHEGEVWTPAHHTRSAPTADAPITQVAGVATTLRGTSACGGRISSTAAVLADVSDAHLLTAGDILVTRQTDPGWGPVFCLVGGLVIERGGMLSHGAIIAREFGLPCVVGIKDATRLIQQGDRLTVDGDAGLCVVEPRQTTLDGAA